MLELTIALKGAGSENMSKLKMLNPTDGYEGITDFVIETIKEAGGRPCPPLFVGIGIGGDFGDRAEGTDQAKGAIYQYSKTKPNDGDATYATELKCTGYSLAATKAASTDTASNDNASADSTDTTSASTDTASTSVTDSTDTSAVATGDFAPIACAGVAIAAASVVVIFSKKRKEA
mgnify:CR=1 FL=1